VTKKNNIKLQSIKNKVAASNIVNVRKINSDDGPLYVLNIGGINIRPYASQKDANRIALFMTEAVVAAILQYEEGKQP